MKRVDILEKLKTSQYIKSQVKNKSEKYKDSYNEYRCVKCRDLKFIIEDNTAIPCECRALRECEDILNNSGISDEFRKKTFKNFNYAYDVQTIDAYHKALSYKKNFKDIEKTRQNSIIFMGQVGSGKTHLSLAISNDLMDSGVGVLYMPYRDVIISLKQNIMDEEYYRKAVGRYKKARVLLIDDLFKGGISKSDINIVFEIINFRYFNNLPMIVSTEKSFDELVEIDEAIGSRIIEMSKDYLVSVKGKKLNYRIYG
ncbi:ATP-binding protein [Romboutsia sp. 1001216sp1]|uniref:ATP-binding protein n=1 Tax=Romboutsia sp. 1001216sp1 TaxID=2986997 RepID=UPI00232C439C|nr:ATP-binding protein [Romboutsia sp. 1001216sp1]MDB8809299.1 ATP-binding protein [Romboutsia sp. 1001216sp1]MDB8817741.1 ATP-binding protein [Romboutsia sp. 1001216sp1]MDB8822517.1 ATP-binding protein [Romboutsia sp. 1001216sp1]